MKELNKIIFALVLITFLTGFTEAICCERTSLGGKCIDVAAATSCNVAYRIDQTACESTEYCSTGTCINNKQGTCVASSQSACDINLGGYWVANQAKDVADCQIGCCLVAGGAGLIEKIKCNVLGAQSGVEADFREGITSQAECFALSEPETKGACVYSTQKGRDCEVKTKEQCASEGKEFHAGLLCSAPELGTICIMTENTMCVDGKNEVYFQDNCENPANVYDSLKVTDVDYWTYIKEPADSDVCGQGASNANSATCGNCDYQLGSTCGPEKLGTGNADFGNFVCRDLNCTYKGNVKEHKESWCSEPIANFENAKPGQISHRLYCYNGEVQSEIKDNYRNYLCVENATSKLAGWIPNRWQDCIFQNNSIDCNNKDKRDCNVVGTTRTDSEGNSITFLDDSGNQVNSMCVPKYTPAFKFWEQTTTVDGTNVNPTQICGSASMGAMAGYKQNLGGFWGAFDATCFAKCIKDCEANLVKGVCQDWCIGGCKKSDVFSDKNTIGQKLGDAELKTDWVTNKQQLCRYVGDCGVKADYLGGDGYRSWKQLFVGNNISKATIANGSSYK